MNNNFFNILFKISAPNVNSYPDIVFDSKNNIMLNSFYGLLRFKNKFDTLNRFINNDFIKDENKELILKYFCKAQKLNFLFKKFYRNHSFKKMQKSTNETDLCFVKLEEHNKKNIITMVQDNVLYNFYIFDLTRIIEKALLNSDMLISDPVNPTNPYTNVDFSYNDLITIYFFLIKNDIEVPYFFKQYFKHNFDLEQFYKYNECTLRMDSIIKYQNQITKLDKYFYIIGFLFEFKAHWNSLVVDIRYPLDELLNLFEMLVNDYVIYKYSYAPMQKLEAKLKIVKKVKSIFRNNFCIGRVYSKHILKYDLSLNPKLKYKEIKVSTYAYIDILDDTVTEDDITVVLNKPLLNEPFYIYT